MGQLAVIAGECTPYADRRSVNERPVVEGWCAIDNAVVRKQVLDRPGPTTFLEVRWRAADDAMIRRQCRFAAARRPFVIFCYNRWRTSGI